MVIKNLFSIFFSRLFKRRLTAVSDQISYQSGPPDLDEMWKNFNRKLSSLLRTKKSPTPFIDFSLFAAFIVILLALWSLTGFYVVEPSEQAIVYTFGRFDSVVTPGLNWHFPYPIQSHEKYNVTGVRTLDVGSLREGGSPSADSVMLTADENIVNIAFSVLYTIKDVKDFAFNNRGTEESLVRQVAEAAIREVVGKNNMDYVLYEGREEIAQATEVLMQSILDRYKTGILVVKVNLQNAQPPEQVQEAFNDAVKAVQDRERQKNEGQAYANNVIPRAQGSAARLMEEAKAYKENVVNIAGGDVSRFNQYLKIYQAAPVVTKERLYLDALSAIYEDTAKVLIDTSTKNSGHIFLSLPSLFPGKSQSAATLPVTADPRVMASAVDGAATGVSSPVEDSSQLLPRFRSQDLLRTRTRESGL